MDEDHRGRDRETERTTIIHTGDGGGGGGTAVAIIAVIILLAILLFAVFGGWLRDTAGDMSVPKNIGVNVNIDGPDVEAPPLDAPEQEAPAPEPEGNRG